MLLSTTHPRSQQQLLSDLYKVAHGMHMSQWRVLVALTTVIEVRAFGALVANTFDPLRTALTSDRVSAFAPWSGAEIVKSLRPWCGLGLRLRESGVRVAGGSVCDWRTSFGYTVTHAGLRMTLRLQHTSELYLRSSGCVGSLRALGWYRRDFINGRFPRLNARWRLSGFRWLSLLWELAPL